MLVVQSSGESSHGLAIILKEGEKLIHPVSQSGSGNTTVTRSHHNPMAALTGEPSA